MYINIILILKKNRSIKAKKFCVLLFMLDTRAMNLIRIQIFKNNLCLEIKCSEAQWRWSFSCIVTVYLKGSFSFSKLRVEMTDSRCWFKEYGCTLFIAWIQVYLVCTCTCINFDKKKFVGQIWLKEPWIRFECSCIYVIL